MPSRTTIHRIRTHVTVKAQGVARQRKANSKVAYLAEDGDETSVGEHQIDGGVALGVEHVIVVEDVVRLRVLLEVEVLDGTITQLRRGTVDLLRGQHVLDLLLRQRRA